VSAYAFHTIKRFPTDQILNALKDTAVLFADELSRMPEPWDADTVQDMCRELGTQTGTRITVVLADGSVLADSEREAAGMENHADRPEVRGALAGLFRHSIRYSDTLRCSMLYLGYPLERNGRVVAAIRTAVPLSAVDASLRALYIRTGAGVAVAMVLAALVSVLMARAVGRPIEAMVRGAVRFANGQLDFRLATPDTQELAGLAESLNSMAGQLDERIRSMDRQRSELEALLAAMPDGVLVVDGDGRVARINQALGWWFGCDPEKVAGRPLGEVIGNPALRDLVDRALREKEIVETDLVLRTDADRFFQAHGTPLKNADGEVSGVLVVLGDVTRLRRS
jgi:two-component system phosphate regulon sensor histidine kinase PhoR